MKSIKHNFNGITLMEVLVSLGIFLLLSLTIYTFIKQSYRIQDFSLEQSISIAEAQRGVESLVKEAREALPSDTGAYAIEYGSTHEFIFYSDFDRDSTIERVRYYLNGSDFVKGVTEPTGNPLQYLPSNEVKKTISRYVRNSVTEPIFYYYNGDWPGDTVNNPLTTPINPTDLRMLKIYLKINVRPERAPTDYILESYVGVRNLKNNL